MSGVGVKLDQFDDPVCNSFQATILNDQLCYQVDLNRVSNKSNIAKEVEVGFYFLMDYNEDRQVNIQSTSDWHLWKKRDLEKERSGLSANLLKSNKSLHAFIYIDTIGKEKLNLAEA